MSDRERLLEVRDLVVAYGGHDGTIYGTAGVSFDIYEHQRVGLVGESGSGKSATALAVLGLALPPGRILRGSVRWRGEDMLDRTIAARHRGRDIAIVFQDPSTSLNPLRSVGNHVQEVLERRGGHRPGEAHRRAVELLERVGIARAAEQFGHFPHEFSGGMRQRVMIAVALASDPRLLIADEPTTALDVTIQAQILHLLRDLSLQMGLAVLLISHDLALISEFCEDVKVMYAGRIVEEAPAELAFAEPAHPYAQALLALSPRIDRDQEALLPIPGEPAMANPGAHSCPFAPRCREALPKCSFEAPTLLPWHSPSHLVSCWNRLG